MARKLDGGRGRLAEAVEAVKDHGVGALHLAVDAKRAEVCEYLVEDVRVDVDAVDICGRTPLVWAIISKGVHVDIVRYLLDHGANPDNVDIAGLTPLHEAAKIGHCEVVELLLSRGAFVDPFSTDHGTPLHVASKHKQDGAMKTLLAHHADVNKVLDNFSSPLMIAIYSRSVKCVNLLLEAGADVKGMRTMTPLLAAVTNGLSGVLKPLLAAGADPNVRNEFGHLPIQLAAHFGTRKDVEILFEVTSSRIPAVHDWSVDGIISYIKSEPKLEDNPLSKMSVAKLKEEGDKALRKEDYDSAVEFYTMASSVVQCYPPTPESGVEPEDDDDDSEGTEDAQQALEDSDVREDDTVEEVAFTESKRRLQIDEDFITTAESSPSDRDNDAVGASPPSPADKRPSGFYAAEDDLEL
ncbi:ankyrin-1-like [Lolium rigidum]|uniref:ankyrin-1-like n=1 Tax=Lolium rigidum TaxID=89674 RepID=UPI001F5D24DA|nr:ankyrin-1-like [Lolium rigidum]